MELTSESIFTNLIIETERLFIRPYLTEDAQALYEVVSDPNFYDYIPETPPSLKEVEGIIKWSIDCNRKNTVDKIYKLNLGIVLKESKEFIGFCGLGPYDINPAKIEIYYGIGKKYRGLGFATEAAEAVLNFGFTAIGLEEIVTTVFPKNLASVKVLERIGMMYEYILNDPPIEHQDIKGMAFYTITKQAYK